jgi:predicted phosphodiesterase
MVLGNNDGEVYGILDHGSAFPNFHLRKNGQYGNGYECLIDGVRIFMHHYPKIAELAAKSGDFDLCIHGHKHRYRAEIFGTALVCNP